jgi:integrase
MPITRHHSGRWLFQFDRVIAGAGRQRANKLLPKGWSKSDAQAFEQRETQRLWNIATGGKQPEPFIEDAVLLYLEDHKAGGKHPLKNHKDIEGALHLMHKFYKGRRMGELSAIANEYDKSATVVAEEGEPAEPLSKATIRNRLAYLRAACRYHWRANKKQYPKPGDGMDLPTVNNKRHIYLQRAQVLTVLRRMGMIEREKQRRSKSADLYVARMAVRVAFYTGWRIGQVLTATPVEAGGVLALSAAPENVKNSQPQIVPVHHRIKHIVRDHWPLQITKWTVSKELKKALVAEGLGHARLHDVRHSAASEMINAGVPLFVVGGVLGHKSQVSTARYAHLVTESLQDAVALIGAKKLQPRPGKRAA